jgi:hypothetical protein
MPLFSVETNHSPQCGTPPSINNDDRNVYVGYFQNEHGEQWVFTTKDRVGELRGHSASQIQPMVGSYSRLAIPAAQSHYVG